jgi:hypothetical protein
MPDNRITGFVGLLLFAVLLLLAVDINYRIHPACDNVKQAGHVQIITN